MTAKQRAKSKPKTEAKDRSMLIQNIDPALWQKFKIRAASEGRTVKWLFDDFIARYASGK